MKIQPVLGLCLGITLLCAAPAAMADKDAPKNARAVQVQLDKKTGKKLSAPDDSDLSAEIAAAEPIVDTKGIMPAAAEPQQYHADGTVSARLGTENLEYLVMTVGENGEKSLSHQKLEHLKLQAPPQDKGEK